MGFTKQNNDIQTLLAEATKEEESKSLTEIERFILEKELLPSDTNKVACFVIYDLYLKWTKVPMKKEEFFKQLSKHFYRTKLGRPLQCRGYWIMCEVELDDPRWLNHVRERKKNQKRFKKSTYALSRIRKRSER